MKTFLLPSAVIALAASASISLVSCNPKLDPNREVDLPETPKNKPYFKNEEKILKGLKGPEQTSTVTINFSGSAIPPTTHNKAQAKAITKATTNGDFYASQFRFTLTGENSTMNDADSLLQYLSSNGVPLRKIEVKVENRSSSQALIEDPSKKSERKVIIQRF